MSFYERACIEINVTALQNNLSVLRQNAPFSSLLAILKCNAYGHGLIRIANLLSSKDGIGVAFMSEAIQLRKAGIKQKIVLLQGCLTQMEYELASQYTLSPVIHNKTQIEWLEACTLSYPLEIWLKVNTGMNRLGFDMKEISTLSLKLKTFSSIKAMVLMSHFASSDYINDQKTMVQITRFNQVIQQLSIQQIDLPKSFANSAAIFEWPVTHHQWIRPGLSLYGISPFLNNHVKTHSLIPVMTVKARLIAIHQLSEGEEVSYCGKFRCPQAMRIGIVSFGFGDGYPFNAPNGTPVLLNNRRAFTIGQVTMDMLMIDLRTHPNACVGDTVVLWGEHLNVTEIAQYTHRSRYELLCNVQHEMSQRFKVKETK